MNRNDLRIVIVFSFLFLSGTFTFAQSRDSLQQRLNNSADTVASQQSSVSPSMLKAVSQMFEWHVRQNDHAYLLTLDIPYPSAVKPLDYFSITVVKWKGKQRPRIISFAVSSKIDKTKGLSIFFAKDTDNQSIKLSNISFKAVPFTKVTPDYLSLSANYMYLGPEDTKDLFKPMMKYNHMIFEFYGKNGHPFSVGYPLYFFQDAMKKYK